MNTTLNGQVDTDCRDEVGITVGLVDAMISIARILAKRDLVPEEVQEALKDLRCDEDIAAVCGSLPFDKG